MYVNFKKTVKAFLMTALSGMLMILSVNAQTGATIRVRGMVTDIAGEPIIGANILVQGTSSGTITDYDGNFTLRAPSDGILDVSYIGYRPQSIPVNNRTTINITMEEDTELLEEVVVIGYGTVRKDDATGSVTAIKPDEMNKGLVTNAQDMLAGKIAGISVISDGGIPGGSAQLRIRGGSSLSASNDPLIVIDGLPMDNNGVQGLANPLSMVNPNDIATFTVLKDASATAIYGSRASNGVIIITTKKGEKGSKPRVSYGGNVSVSSVRNTLDVLTGDEFRAYVNNLYTDEDILSNLGTANTNWQDQIYRTGISTDHNLTVAGGLQNMPYRWSFGYTNQNGIVKTSNFERYTTSLSLAPSFLDDHLNLNLNAKYMYAKNRYADGGAIGSAVSMDPSQSVYSNETSHQNYFGGYFQWDVDGSSLNDETWTRTNNSLATTNPVSILNLKDDRAESHSFIGNIDMDYKFHFLPEMSWHAGFGGDKSGGNQTTAISPYSAGNNYYGYDYHIIQDKYNVAFNTHLKYAKDFGNQKLDVMGGYEWQHFYRDGNSLGYGTTPSTNSVSPGTKVDESENEWASESYLVSFFGRVNYILLDRYLLTGTLRNDGSSRFSEENRWGLFPSIALAWKINHEPVFENANYLSDLKLRLGYGITGQQEINQGDYPYIPVYSKNVAGAYYPLGGEYYTLYRPDAYNADLKWEETTTYNVGIDFGFLNNRITGSADYYHRITDDLLNVVSVPAGTNFDTEVISNIGSLENNGFEFTINAKPVVSKDFTWDLGFNLATNNNKITKLTSGSGEGYYVSTGGISTGVGSNIQAHMVGHAANSFYVYQQVYDESGHPIENLFVDRNGDGIINESDMYIYKKPTANVLLGLSSKFLYKNWDLSFTLRASLGNYVYNDVLASQANVGNSGIWSTSGFFSNRLRSAIDLGYTGQGYYYLSDYFVSNASFLKMDNISLGYSFDKIFNTNINGRIYATAQNVFTITSYDGIDPELSSGIDNNIYPRPFVGILGLTLNF